MTELIKLLGEAMNPNQEIQKRAEHNLTQLKNSNFTEYLVNLCKVLGDANQNPQIRQFSGLLLKNCVGGIGEDSDELRNRWNMQTPQVKSEIKNVVFQVLGSPARDARQTAAIVVAKIASIELPEGGWNELIPHLCNSVANAPNEDLLESSLTCLRYVCEETLNDVLKQHAKLFLMAVLNGMNRGTEPLLVASLQLLRAMSELIREHMANGQDRNEIMKMMCFACGYEASERVRLQGFMCLCRCVTLYYDYFDPYITTIFELTVVVIRKGLEEKESEDVVKQAIEFWSSCGDVEYGILQELERQDNSNRTPARVNQQFILKATGQLIPLYLNYLKKQSDEFDDDTWTPMRAAACSIEVFSRVARNQIVSHVVKFIEANIMQNNDWRSQEAAVAAFGYILDGPDENKLKSMVTEILPLILNLTVHADKRIRRTASWTFGKITMCVPTATTDFNNLLPFLTKIVGDVNAIAHYGCWAIANLAEYYADHNNNAIDAHTVNLIKGLLDRSTRDGVSSNIIASCHEAINSIISYTSDRGVTFQLLPELVNRLQYVATANQIETVQRTNMMSALYSSITVTLQRMCHDGNDGQQSADNQQPIELPHELVTQLMAISIDVLKTDSEIVYEEALLSISALCECIQEHFGRFLGIPDLQTVLKRSILNGEQSPRICLLGAGVIGDIFRTCVHKSGTTIGNSLQKFTDEVVNLLLKNLVSAQIDYDAKPHIIDALTDVALFGANWKRYTKDIMDIVLQLASQTVPQGADSWVVSAWNGVRASSLDVCRSTLMQCGSEGVLHLFVPYIVNSFQLFENIMIDDRRDAECVSQTVRFLYELIAADLYSHFPNANATSTVIQKIITAGSTHPDPDVQQLAQKLHQKFSR